MPDTIPVGKYYNFDNKNVNVVYNPAKDEDKGETISVLDQLIGGNEFGVHLVSNANGVVKRAFVVSLSKTGEPEGLGQFLKSVSLPNAATIGASAFEGCSALTSISLPNAKSIGSNAFRGISHTAVINIGAAEGEITGAPWGAPNGVTINYNVK